MSDPRDLSLDELRDAAELAVTVAAAASAGVFQGLGAGPATPAELADRLGLDARAVAIILPVLADLGWAERRGDGAYALTERGRRLDPASPDFRGGGLPLWLHNLKAWTELPAVLREGGPVSAPADGDDPDDPARIERFMAGMAARPRELVEQAVELCLVRRPGAHRALDLGGGPGLYARAFLERGVEEVTLYDTPAVIDHVADAYGLAGVEGLRLERGDFLVDPLPDGPFDVVLLSNILHIYPPERNRELVRKAADVLAPGGVLAIGDFVRGRSPRAARFALVMLLRTEGGNTYTAQEYTSWLEAAGLADVRIDDLADGERQIVSAVRAL